MTQTTLQVLQAARELISVPERWTQEFFARNREGKQVRLQDTGEDGAVCWCAWGALMKVTGDRLSDYDPSYIALESSMPDLLPFTNDSSTHEQVLAYFDKAIAAEEIKEESAAPTGAMNSLA